MQIILYLQKLGGTIQLIHQLGRPSQNSFISTIFQIIMDSIGNGRRTYPNILILPIINNQINYFPQI